MWADIEKTMEALNFTSKWTKQNRNHSQIPNAKPEEAQRKQVQEMLGNKEVSMETGFKSQLEPQGQGDTTGHLSGTVFVHMA